MSTARGYRAEFCFPVTETTFDLFFNGQHGYRAQYYRDPERGIKKNKFLLDRIKPLLFKIASMSKKKGVTEEEVENSLNFPSAKVWILQRCSSLQKDIPRPVGKNKKLPDPTAILTLDIPRWEGVMYRGYQAWQEEDQLRWCKERKALFGVQAPIGTYLEVKGAWIYEGREDVTEDKKDRAQQIHDYGFS